MYRRVARVTGITLSMLLHSSGVGWSISTFVVSCDIHGASSKNHACLHLNSRENWGVKYIFANGKWYSNRSILSRIYLKIGLFPLATCHPSVTLVTLWKGCKRPVYRHSDTLSPFSVKILVGDSLSVLTGGVSFLVVRGFTATALHSPMRSEIPSAQDWQWDISTAEPWS